MSLNAEIAPEPEKPEAHEPHAKPHAHAPPHPKKHVPEEDPESDLDLDMTGVVGKILFVGAL